MSTFVCVSQSRCGDCLQVYFGFTQYFPPLTFLCKSYWLKVLFKFVRAFPCILIYIIGPKSLLAIKKKKKEKKKSWSFFLSLVLLVFPEWPGWPWMVWRCAGWPWVSLGAPLRGVAMTCCPAAANNRWNQLLRESWWFSGRAVYGRPRRAARAGHGPASVAARCTAAHWRTAALRARAHVCVLRVFICHFLTKITKLKLK